MLVHHSMDSYDIDIDVLRKLIETSGSNKHDKAINLITVAISEGINTKRQIIALGMCLGLNRGHVAITLNSGAGTNSAAHRWRMSTDGVYSLLSRSG